MLPPSATSLLLLLSLNVKLCASEDEYSVEKMKEIGDAREGAVIAVGMVDALSEGPEVADYLDSHAEYAAEFGQFAVYAVHLATRVLGMIRGVNGSNRFKISKRARVRYGLGRIGKGLSGSGLVPARRNRPGRTGNKQIDRISQFLKTYVNKVNILRRIFKALFKQRF